MPSARATQLIDALLARQQEPPILEKKTRLPYGWAIWFRALSPLPRPLHAREIVAVLIPRPLPASPGRLPQLGAWTALRRLAWQQWEPAPRDQRWMRWTSAAVSVLLHLLFAFLLLWVALVRSPTPETQGGDGERVQVEFVGQGAQEGGGDQPGGDPAAAAAASAAQAAAEPSPASNAAADASPPPAETAPASASAASPAETQPLPPQPAPAPPVPADPAPPVQATTVVEPTTDFIVPPVTVPRTEVTVVPREVAPTVREREVRPLSVPTPAVPTVTTEVRPRPVTRTVPEVREREVTLPVQAPTPVRVAPAEVTVRVPVREPAPVREREVTTVTAPTITLPTLKGNEPVVQPRPAAVAAVRERSVANAVAPSPSRPSPAASSASSSSSSNAASQNAAQQRTGDRAAAAPARAGAQPSPTPGNWATPARGDDWGASNRNQAGAPAGAQAGRAAGKGDGLFNADGSTRVPGQDGKGDSERGAPGGDSDGWSRERIAASGTWLKRPPYDYTPTSFDKYWVPQESLLAEWVRKGVQSVEIPIPGTSTKISCVISVLQFGGGCGLNDPNMQEQPAIARPPPDIPFKKELQEDNGSR